MVSVPRKIRLVPKIFKTFSNWPKCYAVYLGLVKDDVAYTLRDSTRILARPDPVDIGVILDVCALDCYQAADIGKEDIVVDVGAHIGTFSLLAAKRATDGKVFAFEPLPQNFSLLKKNIELNSLNNVYAINKAVSGKQEKRKLFLQKVKGKLFSSAASFFTEAQSPEFVEVETTTLGDILGLTGRIDFLKIDAEGGEVEILRNLDAAIFNRIKRISLECHDYYFKSDIAGELTDILSRHGFKVETQTTLFTGGNSEMLHARKG